MNRSVQTIFALLFCASTIGFVACQTKSDAASKVAAQQVSVQTAIINIPTAKCSSCAKHIKTAVKEVDGVTAINVNIDAHTAEVKFISTKTNMHAIESAIAMSGYTANKTVRDSAAYAGLDDCCKE